MNPTYEDAAEQKRRKNQAYCQANKERLREYRRAYQKKHRARLNALKRAAYDDERKAAKKSSYQANRERILRQKQDYYLRKLEFIKAYRQRNKEKLSEDNSRWHKENRERIRARKRVDGTRRRQNPSNRIAGNLRRRLTKLIGGRERREGCEVLLGCSFEHFREHMDRRFKPGMSWDNYGAEWHVDHIIPCSSFDPTKKAHVRQCFHFTNLQPMWARDNLRKGTKLTDPQLRLLL